MDPELLLQEPKEVLLEQLPRPEIPREHENAQAIADREARDQLARDKINLENEERRARGPKVGHNVYYNEVQKRVASRLFLALGTEGKKKFVQKNPHVEVSKLEFREMVHWRKCHLINRRVLHMNVTNYSIDHKKLGKHSRHFMQH